MWQGRLQLQSSGVAHKLCHTVIKEARFPMNACLNRWVMFVWEDHLQLHFFPPSGVVFKLLHSVSSPLLNEKGTLSATFPHWSHHQVSFLQPLLFKKQLELISGICTLPPTDSVGIDRQVQKFLGKLGAVWTWQNLLSLGSRLGGASLQWGICFHCPWDMVATSPSSDTAHTDPGPATRQALVTFLICN